MTGEKDTLADLDCACANVRRLARLVTQFYSLEMGDIVEPPQFALLSALSQVPGCGQSSLGRALGFDKTTLSRNLRLMERNGWLEQVRDNHRQRGYRLSAAGRKTLAAATPGWKRAQARLRAEIGDPDWETMFTVMNRVARIAQAATRTKRA